MIDYDNMLYPQYKNNFSQTISKETFEALQKAAEEKLKAGGAHPIVEEHWKSIVSGNVPFGYMIDDNK